LLSLYYQKRNLTLVYFLEISDEENSYITFLKTALEPHEKILSYWEKTFVCRNPTSCDKSINEYFNLYPALKLNNGYMLLECDFDNIYPDKKEKIYNSFPKIAEAIIQVARIKKIKLPHFRDRCLDSIEGRQDLCEIFFNK
jgi:hypothetical protein